MPDEIQNTQVVAAENANAAAPVVQSTPAPAESTPAAVTPTPAAKATPESIRDGALAALDNAFDGGIGKVDPAKPESAPVQRRATKATAPVTPDPAAREAADGRARGPDGKFLPAGTPTPAVVATDPTKPAVVPPGPAATAAAIPDPAVEKEIADLKLGPAASERFRALNNDIKALAPLKEVKATLEKSGITDFKTLPAVIDRAKRAGEWESYITDTRSTPQQVGEVFDALKLLNSGDPAQMGRALDYLQAQCDGIAQRLGRATGTYNPLTDHPDIARDVEDGNITQERALELAKLRGAGALTAQNQQRQQQQTQTERQQAEFRQRGLASLDTLESQLVANDPHWASKQAAMVEIVKKVAATLPPGQWAQASLDLYRMIPNPAAAAVAAPAVRVPVGPVPMRANGAMRNLAPAPKTAMEALNFGLATLEH